MVKFSGTKVHRASVAAVTVIMLLFLVGLVALVLTGGYRIELAGMRLSSNSLLPPLVGFSVFAILRIALTASLAEFALLAGSVVFTLLLAEGFLRWLDPPIAAPALTPVHRPSDVFGYELIPLAEGVGSLGEHIAINAEGNRDQPFDPSGTAPTIVVIGDSFTFGMGVEMEDVYVDQLERSLRAHRSGLQVVNLGVIAYAFWQYLEVLNRRALHYQPDLVIIGFFLDDLTKVEKPDGTIAEKPFQDFEPEVLSGSSLLNAARNTIAWLEARYRSQRGADYLASLEKRRKYISEENPDNLFYRIQTGALETARYEAFDRGAHQLAAWSSQNGVPILVVFIPDASQLNDASRQHVNQRVAEAFERAGVPFVDTTPRFETLDDPSSVFLFPLDAHTNAAGHQLITETIVEHPLVQSLLPDPAE